MLLNLFCGSIFLSTSTICCKIHVSVKAVISTCDLMLPSITSSSCYLNANHILPEYDLLDLVLL